MTVSCAAMGSFSGGSPLLRGYKKAADRFGSSAEGYRMICLPDKLEFIVLSKPIFFFFSKYGNITISIWIVIMKIATKLF